MTVPRSIYVRDNNGYYKHSLPALNLSIERNSGRVPNDGRFYIVQEGGVVDSFRSKKKAEAKFYEMVEASGYKPEIPVDEPKSPADESMERYALSKDIFWAEGPKYRKKGGRGGRGGI